MELVHLGGAPGLAAVARLGAAGVGPVVEGEGELAQHTYRGASSASCLVAH